MVAGMTTFSRAHRGAGHRWAKLAGAVSFALFFVVANDSNAQGTPAGDSGAPPAAPADVRSIAAVIHAAYDVISGPAGARDWNRFYSLFAPGARLIRTLRDSTGPAHLQPMTPHEFAALAGDYFSKNPFYENEIGRESNTFGAVTQAFSAYQSKHAPGDAKPFARGINSFQLFNDGKRWYIVTIYWDDEHAGVTIPDRYLHTAP
jgi:hypothetical protein